MAARNLVIGFDADDTLWHNESIFEASHEHYRALLAKYHDADTVDRTLLATELRNIETYGYGIKGFTLSAVETAIQLTAGKISSDEIQRIIDLGKSMLAHPVELLDGVADTLGRLAAKHPLLLITKGDLRDQERKVQLSGLAAYFQQVEIISEKNEASYAAVLQRHRIAAKDFLMIGNSLKSDIVPILNLGGYAIHIPYRITWAIERVEKLPDTPGRFFERSSLSEIEAVVQNLS